MSKTAKQQLKTWFQNLKKPTQEQFWHWLDSYWHKDEKIPQENIEGWDEFLKSLPNDGELKNYLLRDGANINAENREVLRAKLGVRDLPPNLGLVDAEEEGNVYTKAQVEALLPTKNLSNANQIIPEGKIREIDVQGRLDIKNLEKKKEDDLQFSNVLIQDEIGTTAKTSTKNWQKFKLTGINGNSITKPQGTDLKTLTKTGYFTIHSPIGQPPKFTYGIIDVLVLSQDVKNTLTQIAWSPHVWQDGIWMRFSNAYGDWQPWLKVITSRDTQFTHDDPPNHIPNVNFIFNKQFMGMYSDNYAKTFNIQISDESVVSNEAYISFKGTSLPVDNKIFWRNKEVFVPNKVHIIYLKYIGWNRVIGEII